MVDRSVFDRRLEKLERLLRNLMPLTSADRAADGRVGGSLYPFNSNSTHFAPLNSCLYKTLSGFGDGDRPQPRVARCALTLGFVI